MGFSLFAASRGYSPVAVLRLLIVVASVSEHGTLGPWTSVTTACGLNGCGSSALDHSLGSCGAGS